jgi:hypothetical protein
MHDFPRGLTYYFQGRSDLPARFGPFPEVFRAGFFLRTGGRRASVSRDVLRSFPLFRSPGVFCTDSVLRIYCRGV